MQLVLDVREKRLIEGLPDAPVRMLTLGDVVIEKDGAELMIFERKTGADLAASLCDGRYRDQSERLKDCGLPLNDIVYIIEGSLHGHGVPHATLLAVLSSLNRKGFSVMRTDSVEETIAYVSTVLKQMLDPKTSVTVVKRAKKDSITPENIAAIMLAQIPYVSFDMAKNVLAGKTIEQFSAALRENPTMLDTMTVNKRRVSKRTVASIKTFLK